MDVSQYAIYRRHLGSYDNALAETINGLYKEELIHRRGPWRTREAVELATLEWVAWFNHVRLLEPIGYIPPAEAEANYYRQLAVSDRINGLHLNQMASTKPGAVHDATFQVSCQPPITAFLLCLENRQSSRPGDLPEL